MKSRKKAVKSTYKSMKEITNDKAAPEYLRIRAAKVIASLERSKKKKRQ